MSKTNPRCELVSGEDISYFEGKLKTFIESLGLPEKQEKSAKDVSQTILWDWFNFITGHIVDHLSEKKDWYDKHTLVESSGASRPRARPRVGK